MKESLRSRVGYIIFNNDPVAKVMGILLLILHCFYVFLRE